jgi:F-type H+-transporting ATPase subunit delta
MTETRTDNYAEAFHLIAGAEGAPHETEDELYRFARALDANEELRSTLADPHLPTSRRLQIVEDLLGGQALPTTVALVSMAVTAGRAADLPKIIDEVVRRSAESKGAVVAEARSAVPLSHDQQERLTAAIAKATGREVTLRTIVDPSVVGGVVTNIGDAVLDGSVRTRLAQLREAF